MKRKLALLAPLLLCGCAEGYDRPAEDPKDAYLACLRVNEMDDNECRQEKLVYQQSKTKRTDKRGFVENGR